MSNSWNQPNDDDEDELFKTEEVDDYSNHDSILMVIDASPPMLQPQDNGEIPLQSALECVKAVLLSKAFSSPSDSVGVMVYGTRSKQNDAGHDHIYILQNMDSPDAPRIKEIESLAANISGFEEEYGSVAEEFPLGNVFWTASNIFSLSTKKKGLRRIFLITNEDNPHSTDISLRNAAIRRAKDLLEVGIRIELFGIDKPDHTFNNESFYTSIIESDEAIKTAERDSAFQTPVEAPKSSNKLADLLQLIRRKQIKKRSEFRIPLHLNDELTIGVVGYALVREQVRSSFQKVLVTGEQVKEVDSVVTWKCVDTDQLLLPTDIKFYYNVGNEPIVFTKDELDTIRNFGEPGIRIIGFMDQHHVQEFWNITHAYFIYPNEFEYHGSTRTFTALLRSTVKGKKAILCSIIRRTNALPKIAVLFPQEEALDKQGVQVRPPGFHVIIMPYADDIRPVPVDRLPTEATDEQIDAVKAFVEKLALKGRFDPLVYENPFLQRHYAGLEAAALEHPIEAVVDKTLPRNEAIFKRIGNEIQAFNEIVQRSSAASQPSQYNQLDDEVEVHWRDQSLNQCTVPILKQWLLNKGLAAKGRKADLLAQVDQYLKAHTQT
ncbi:SPOC like C-terminal domain-containing protein [Umbelopsis sp. AD052]|nr:SPOC like C-terminal domain-containing protein [Umbelopsis sp. AD052]